MIWEKFNEDVLLKMIQESNSYTEWGKKMGYKKFDSSKAEKILEKYPLLRD